MEIDGQADPETSIASSTQGNKDDKKEQVNRSSGAQTDKDQRNNYRSDVENARPISPGTLALLCDERDTMFMSSGPVDEVASCSKDTNQKSSSEQGFTEVYAEQERVVLTRFWDYLNKLIIFGSIKGRDPLFLFTFVVAVF